MINGSGRTSLAALYALIASLSRLSATARSPSAFSLRKRSSSVSPLVAVEVDGVGSSARATHASTSNAKIVVKIDKTARARTNERIAIGPTMAGKRPQMEKPGRMEDCTIAPNPGHGPASGMLDTRARCVVARVHSTSMHGTRRKKGKRASSCILDTCTRGIVARAYVLSAMHRMRQRKGDRAALCTRHAIIAEKLYSIGRSRSLTIERGVS